MANKKLPWSLQPIANYIILVGYPQSSRNIEQWKSIRRDGRVVDGARLESVYTATYRGFESLSLRQTSI